MKNECETCKDLAKTLYELVSSISLAEKILSDGELNYSFGAESDKKEILDMLHNKKMKIKTKVEKYWESKNGN